MTDPTGIYRDVRRREDWVRMTPGARSVTLELAGYVRTFIAALSTGATHLVEASLRDLAAYVGKSDVMADALREIMIVHRSRVAEPVASDPNWQARVWQRIETERLIQQHDEQPGLLRRAWRRIVGMLALCLVLGGCSSCRNSQADRQRACDVERLGHAEWVAHPQWHCRRWKDLLSGETTCTPEPSTEDCQ